MIKTKIFRKTMLLITLIISSYAFIITVYTTQNIETKILKLEEKHAKEVLNKIALISKLAYKDLESFKKEAIANKKNNLKNIMNLPFYILKEYNELYKNGKISLKDAKKTAFEKISKLRYGDSGYFFILSDDYVLLSHPDKNIQGTNHYNLKDIKGRYFSREIVDNTRLYGETFTYYYWAKIISKPFKKISYSKVFKPWDIYVGTGVYIDDIQKEVTKRGDELFEQIKTIMKSTKIGKTGYVFVANKEGKFIIHPNKSLVGKHMPNKIFRKIQLAAKTKKHMTYKWNKPNDSKNYTYDKWAWVEYIPEQDWYIGASIYLEDFQKSADKFNMSIAFISISLLFIALFVSYVFFEKLLKPILDLSKTASRVASGDYSARAKIKTNDEIGELSINFNSMIKNIEKNRQKENQLIEQSKLAQMGEMMSMIAHQWRQPLGAIGSAVMGIQVKIKTGKYGLETQENKKQFLEYLEIKHNRINEYVQFLSNTIDDFREFFKLDIEKRLTPLTTPIKKALQIVEISLVNKAIELQVNFQADNKVLIHKNEIMQVILNIIKNSEDNFIEKKTIKPKITITTKQSSEKNIITIEDNGGGIPKEILPKIFDPYFSTKLEKNGTGLGLYMSKNIIEKHNKGSLYVANTKDGVRFTIELSKTGV